MGTVRYTVLNGEVIAEKRNGVRRQYVPDPLGSTVALLDNTQAQTDTFDYWPYGEKSNRTGTTATPFRFVGTLGQYRDSSTRDYARARVLDKQKGRWLTEDPIGFDGGDWNLYRYVSNSCITYIDPNGLDSPTINCDKSSIEEYIKRTHSMTSCRDEKPCNTCDWLTNEDEEGVCESSVYGPPWARRHWCKQFRAIFDDFSCWGCDHFCSELNSIQYSKSYNCNTGKRPGLPPRPPKKNPCK